MNNWMIDHFKETLKYWTPAQLKELLNDKQENPNARTAAYELLGIKQSEEKPVNQYKTGDKVVHRTLGIGVITAQAENLEDCYMGVFSGWVHTVDACNLTWAGTVDTEETDQEEQEAENTPEATDVYEVYTSGEVDFTKIHTDPLSLIPFKEEELRKSMEAIRTISGSVHLMHPYYTLHQEGDISVRTSKNIKLTPIGSNCPHQWEHKLLFSSSYQKCKLCGEEQ